MEQEVCGSAFGQVKLNVVKSTAHYHCHISSKEPVLPRRNDAYWLYASAEYSEYNEKFDFDSSFKNFKAGFKEK